MATRSKKTDDAGWLRFGAAAKQLGVSPYVLRRWSVTGILPCYFSTGGQRRYRSADVAALVRARAASPEQAATTTQTVSTTQAAPAAPLDALAGPLAASLDPVEVAQSALALLGNLVEFDVGAVISSDASDVARLLYATPALAAELVIAGLGRQHAALLSELLGPEAQESVQVRKLDGRQTLLAESPLLGEMRRVAVVGLYAHGERLGALWLASRHAGAYGATQREYIARLAADLGRALANALLHERVKRSHLGVLKALGSALGAKDVYSLSHASRVAGYMALLGRELGWSTSLIDKVEETAYLHDVGKISVPGRVLTSTTTLNEHEWELIKKHSVFGAEIMAPLFGEDLVLAVRHHHERYGGGGYPDGLIGEDIPLLARAMCVADAYDAMSYDRPYRGALSYADCLTELDRGRGTQFDPVMVDAFLRALRGLDAQRQVGRRAAVAAAKRMDIEMHRRLALSRDPASADYVAIAQILREERDARPPTRYLQTVIAEGERCVYLVDCEEAPRNWSPPGEEVVANAGLLRLALNGAPLERNVLHADSHGIWLASCHAPVTTPDGEIAALVLASVPAPLSPHKLEGFSSVTEKSIDERRQLGRQAAAAAAKRIDAEMHRRLALNRDLASEDYAAISQILREERDAHPPTRYLSTVIVDGESCIYLAGSEEDSLNLAPMGMEVPGGGALLRVLSGEPLEWNALYADSYGLWVTSCHAPVVASDGEVVSLVVASMPAPLSLREFEGPDDIVEKSVEARRYLGRQAAAAAAKRIDIEMHRRLAMSRNPESAEYKAIAKILREERDARPPTRYLTTVIAEGERCIYLVDGEEDPRNWSPPGEEITGGSALLRILDGEPLEWNALYADNYGFWVTTCHAPVVSPNGEVIALVVAAMPAPRELEGPSSAATEAFVAAPRDAASSSRPVRPDSLTDGLTGLYNHRYMRERLAEEMQRAHEQNLTLSLLFLSIDHFKDFNDRFGRAVGDAVLCTVAAAINNSVRQLDLAARYGDEEFIVALPNTGLADALAMAEDIRQAIAETPLEASDVKLSASVGVTVFPHDAETADDLIDKAIWAMHLAEHSGYDRVAVFSDANL